MIKKLGFVWLVALLGFQVPAAADSAYRYWSFWVTSDGSWSLASAGAGSTPATAGSVQGWRFVTAGVAVDPELSPRAPTDFNQICSASQAETHIAIVIDYGFSSDYANNELPPSVESFCVETDSQQNSLIALSQIVEIREDSGFICGLNNFPADGCAEAIDLNTTDAPKENQSNPSESELPVFGYTIALIALAATAWLFVRRRNPDAQ